MKQSTRWLPALIAPVVVLGAVAVPAVADAATPAASASSTTAREVLASIAGSSTAAYSGKIRQTSDLGLPSLPNSTMPSGAGSSTAGNASAFLELLTSDHTARVYADGRSKQRVQVLDSLAERDVIHNGSDVWTWDSKKNAATHVTLPSGSATASGSAGVDMGSQTPSSLAATFLTGIRPTTTVSEPVAVHVVGRDAYRITLTPKSSTTLVAKVVLTVDKATGLPLSTVVDARGQSAPAIDVAFSSISFSTPSSSLFDFTPPSDARVHTKDLSHASGSSAHAWKHSDAATPGAGTTASPRPSVSGTGWDTVVSLPAGSADASALDASGSKLLGELTKQVSGGRAVETSLFSVLLRTDGSVAVGAVPVASLTAATE